MDNKSTLNKLYSEAASEKKPSRDSIIEAIEEHVLRREDYMDGDTMALMRKLLAHFAVRAPQKSKASKCDATWVALACSRDDSRKALQYYCYNPERNELVSTDGKRLHLVKNVNMGSNAIYFNSKTRRPEDRDIQFPNYTQILSVPAPGSKVEQWEETGRTCKGENIVFQATTANATHSITLCAKWYADVAAGMPESTIYVNSDKHAIIFESGSRYALIMPLVK